MKGLILAASEHQFSVQVENQQITQSVDRESGGRSVLCRWHSCLYWPGIGHAWLLLWLKTTGGSCRMNAPHTYILGPPLHAGVIPALPSCWGWPNTGHQDISQQTNSVTVRLRLSLGSLDLTTTKVTRSCTEMMREAKLTSLASKMSFLSLMAGWDKMSRKDGSTPFWCTCRSRFCYWDCN